MSALTKTDLFGESINKGNNNPINITKDEKQKDEKQKDEQPKNEQPKVVQGKATEPTASDSNSEYESESESVQPEEEEEVDDMEIAWELLDSARLIYSSLPVPTSQTDTILADIHMTLGDISAESLSWQLAIEDYLVSLDLKKKMLKESNRQLAEMHYKIALAYEYLKDFQATKDHLEKSIGVLNMKIGELLASSGDKGKVNLYLIKYMIIRGNLNLNYPLLNSRKK